MHIKTPTAGPHVRGLSITLSNTPQMVRIQILLVQQKAAVSSPRYLLEKPKQSPEIMVSNLRLKYPLGTEDFGDVLKQSRLLVVCLPPTSCYMFFQDAEGWKKLI